MRELIVGCALGLLATISMDLVNLLISISGWINKGDIQQVGSFVQIVLTTLELNDFIAIENESALILAGVLLHVFVGCFYGVLFLLSLSKILQHQSLTSIQILIVSWCFGVLTTLAPFLVFQPTVGLGYFASNAENTAKVVLTSLFNHSVFGISLWMGYQFLEKAKSSQQLKYSEA